LSDWVETIDKIEEVVFEGGREGQGEGKTKGVFNLSLLTDRKGPADHTLDCAEAV